MRFAYRNNHATFNTANYFVHVSNAWNAGVIYSATVKHKNCKKLLESVIVSENKSGNSRSRNKRYFIYAINISKRKNMRVRDIPISVSFSSEDDCCDK